MNLNHQKALYLGILSILVISFVSACAVTPKTTPVSQDFLNNPSKIGIVWVSFSPHPICNTASAGLLGQSFAKKANEQIIERIKLMQFKPLMEKFYMDTFEKEFTSLEFQVFRGNPIIEKWSDWSLSYGEWPKVLNKGRIPDDYNQFINENNLDYLLIVDVVFFGISKPLTGVPFGLGVKPQIYSITHVYLADAKDNTVISENSFSINKKLPEQDEPPEFPAVINEMEQTLQEGIDQIFVFVFQKAP